MKTFPRRLPYFHIPALLAAALLLPNAAGAALYDTPTTLVSGIQPEKWLHVADMDDGRGSVLYSPQPGTLVLLRKDAGGDNYAQTLIATGVARVLGARTADMNGNGHQDIVAALELPNGQFAIRVLYWTTFGTHIPLDPDYLPGGVPSPQAPLLLADVDRDGKMDIMTCWKTSATGTAKGRAGYFRNLGGNDFAGIASLFLATFDEPCALSAADFNADGKPDFTVADNGRSEVRIFPGPAFVAPTTLTTSSPPLRILADNDGTDRWPDLLVMEGGFDYANNQPLRRYANNGGTFATAQTLGVVPSHSGDFHAADLNFDGKQDLVFAPDDGGTRALNIRLNDGSPVPVLNKLYLTAQTPAPLRAAALFDDDRDGDLDILAVTDNALVRYSNTFAHRVPVQRVAYRYSSNGSAPQPPSRVLAVDLNGDGKDDVVTASPTDGKVRIYFNSGGQLSTGPVLTRSAVRFVAAGDLDRDGDLDLVVNSIGDNRVVWYGNNGIGTSWAENVIQRVISIPTGVAVGDVNLDGNLDIVVSAAGTQTLHLLTNNGDASGWTLSTIGTGIEAGFISIADVTRGGRPEVLVQRADSGVRIFSYSGGWSETELVAGASGATGQGLAVADLSGDGLLDIAYGWGTAAYALIQNSGGTFTQQTLGIGFHFENSVNFENVPRSIQTADVDQDGLDDVITTFRYSGMVFVRGRPESGRSTTAIPFLTNASVEAGDTAPVDVDGDGCPDLVRRDSASLRMVADITTPVHHVLSVRRLPAYGNEAQPYTVLTQSHFGMLSVEAFSYAWPSDGETPLNGLRLRFLQHASPYAPLTGTSLASLFPSFSVRIDAGEPGLYQPTIEPLVAGLATPSADAGGVVELAFPAGAASVPGGGARSFFVTAETSDQSGWAIQATVPTLPYSIASSDTGGYATSAIMSVSGENFHMWRQPPTILQSWRFFHFNDPYSQGRGANELDFDGDGLSNLVEFCLGTNPRLQNSSPIDMLLNGSVYFLAFPERIDENSGARFYVRSSPDMKIWHERAYRDNGQDWQSNNIILLTESSLNSNQEQVVISLSRKTQEYFRLGAHEIAP
ncbi:MAG: VCBS repeat-containing protein [Verrucomicrobiales bacterium]